MTCSGWWRYVPGACWRQPQGPGGSIEDKDDHPVVRVSYEDVLAYVQWSGGRLPTETEWEFAARGGLEQAAYVWGDEERPISGLRANNWDTLITPIPRGQPRGRGATGTMPVGNFPANDYGLREMTGNAWQWVAGWYRADQLRRQQPHRQSPGSGRLR